MAGGRWERIRKVSFVSPFLKEGELFFELTEVITTSQLWLHDLVGLKCCGQTIVVASPSRAAAQCCLRTTFDLVLYTGGLYAESIDARSYYDLTTTSDKREVRRTGADDDKGPDTFTRPFMHRP